MAIIWTEDFTCHFTCFQFTAFIIFFPFITLTVRELIKGCSVRSCMRDAHLWPISYRGLVDSWALPFKGVFIDFICGLPINSWANKSRLDYSITYWCVSKSRCILMTYLLSKFVFHFAYCIHNADYIRASIRALRTHVRINKKTLWRVSDVLYLFALLLHRSSSTNLLCTLCQYFPHW